MSKKTTVQKLSDLWFENKKTPKIEYVDELLEQIELIGTESNTLSRDYVLYKIKSIKNKIENTLKQ